MAVQFPYKRIAVIGTSGSGKTTLSRTLAARLGISHIELDAHYHRKNWTETPWEIFRDTVNSSLQAERWVCDGNYLSRADQLRMADLVIWLDYPFSIVITRILKRTIKRLLTKEELWNGNKETWSMALSKNSIVLWVLQTYWKRKRELPDVLASLKCPSITFAHPRQTRLWLSQLS